MRLVLFYRSYDMEKSELAAAQVAGFHCVPSRMMIEKGDLVVGRYSVLPYFKETAADIEYTGAQLINGPREHYYVADLANWLRDLEDLTPKTWRAEDFFRETMFSEEDMGSFVLKGQTNSRKDRWSTHMLAKTRQDVSTVFERLLSDGLLGQAGEGHQTIYVRQYIPLVTYAFGIGGLPITKEFRIFVARGEILTGAYYWSSWADTCIDQDPDWREPDVEEVPQEFLREVTGRIGRKVEFYCVDVAQDTAGRWWVVELNDGQQSGLSGNKPERLYGRLAEVLRRSG